MNHRTHDEILEETNEMYERQDQYAEEARVAGHFARPDNERSPKTGGEDDED